MGQIVRKNRKSILMELSDDKNREEAMKKIQRSIIFVIGILLWVMQGQSVFAAGSTELLSGTIANTTISYRLTEDGTLTIYSDNIEEMPNYTVNSTVPWAAQKDKIKKVQINSYLKNIGDYAFYGCDSLESVVIQDSKLTEIGIAAFKNCKNLKTINIPETVKAIGTMGFANCNSLQSTKKNPVVIPKGNTEIMDFAFAGCKSMQYIKIPASVEMIGNCAFFECDFLSEIEIEEGQLQEIGDYAFTDCEMESIVIPTKTGKIGEYAFSDCKRLEKIWFLYANGTDTQEIAGNMLQGSSHVNALYLYSGKSYESWAKNNGFSDKLIYIHNMSSDNSNYKVWFRERERNETGVLKKRIVEVKEYEHPGANNWNGIIKGRKPGISVNISIPNGAYIMQEDNNMAMLIENEDGNFYLIPRIEAERESSKQEQ